MKKVVKFGGSSLASAEQFKKVGDIIRSDESRAYVVPSAPGKRFSDDIKITDMLYQCYNLAREASTKEEFETCYSNICARFQGIITDLGLDFDISGELSYIKNAILGRAGRDFAASRGEYLSGLILAKFIGFDFIDAENVILFKDNGRVFTSDSLSQKIYDGKFNLLTPENKKYFGKIKILSFIFFITLCRNKDMTYGT